MSVLPLDEHLQWRRGITEKINTYAGVDGEFVLDTTKNTIVLLSGTAGTNYPLATEADLNNVKNRTLTAGRGIKFVVDDIESSTANLSKNFSVKVNPSDIVASNDILTVDESGKLKNDFTLNYVAATGKFSINLPGGAEYKSITIPSHLSVLKDVSLVVATPEDPIEGQTSGTFLKFIFTKSDGTDTAPIYVNVTDLIDLYTAGNGLNLVGKEFSVQGGNGIQVSATGVAAKIKNDEQILKVDANGLYIDKNALKSVTDQTIVSADVGNIIAEGTDDGALLKIAGTGSILKCENGILSVPSDLGVIE